MKEKEKPQEQSADFSIDEEQLTENQKALLDRYQEELISALTSSKQPRLGPLTLCGHPIGRHKI